jgi:hypothetical protein
MPRPRLSLSEELSVGLVLSAASKGAVYWGLSEEELAGAVDDEGLEKLVDEVPPTVTVAVEPSVTVVGAKLEAGGLKTSSVLVAEELFGGVDDAVL